MCLYLKASRHSINAVAKVMAPPRKHPLDTSATANSRVYKRISAPKRTKTRHTSLFAQPVRGNASIPAAGVPPSREATAPHDTSVPQGEQPPSYLFTFTGALLKKLEDIEVAPAFVGSAEGAGQPLHTVDEALEEILFNHPRSGKVSFRLPELFIGYLTPHAGPERDDDGLVQPMWNALPQTHS